MRIKLNVLLLLCFLGFQVHLKSQTQLVFSMVSGNQEVFFLEEIRSMRFENDEIVLHLLEGIDYRFDIEDVEQYYFVGVESVKFPDHRKDTRLKVFPNPSDGEVEISISQTSSNQITLDILDFTGKSVKTIYLGRVTGDERFNYDLDLPPGVYLCRALTEAEALTQLFIIQ